VPECTYFNTKKPAFCPHVELTFRIEKKVKLSLQQVVKAHRVVRRIVQHCLLAGLLNYSSTLKMEAMRSSETSGTTQRTTRRHIPEEDTLQNHRCENLKSYIINRIIFLNNINRLVCVIRCNVFLWRHKLNFVIEFRPTSCLKRFIMWMIDVSYSMAIFCFVLQWHDISGTIETKCSISVKNLRKERVNSWFIRLQIATQKGFWLHNGGGGAQCSRLS
jgi:hypothetical protein